MAGHDPGRDGASPTDGTSGESSQRSNREPTRERSREPSREQPRGSTPEQPSEPQRTPPLTRRGYLQAVGAAGLAGATGAGSAVAQSGDVVVEGGGADIWNDEDAFHYYFADVGREFDAAVRVDDVEDTDEYAKAGLMLRESLDADAKNVMVRTTPDHTSVQWRPSAGAESTSLTSDDGESESEIDGGTIDASWQRLVRTGDTLRAYASQDGENWTLLAELTMSFGDSVYLGLAVTSHDEGTLCRGEFSELAGVAPVESRDVGDVSVAGSASGGSTGETSPLAITGSARSVGSSSATLAGSVLSLGGASSASVSLEYRETGSATWSSVPAGTVASAGGVEADVSGLSPETEYEYRIVVEASDGESDDGAVVSFSTLEVDTEPAISTGEPGDVYGTSAELTGTLEAIGGQADAASVWFEYREVGADEWTESGTHTLDEAGEFSTGVYGLSPETQYEYRARVEADDGDAAVGATSTFATTEGSAHEGGSHFHPEDGFADLDWFDEEEVEVIRIQEAELEPIQDAFTTEGPRVIVFEESGVVDLEGADLSITYGDCWVAGQTAPSPGITFIDGMVQVEGDNTIVEHIRVLRGEDSGGEGTDPMNSRDGTENVIFNHCSVFWGRDENMSVGYDSDRTTIANSLIAEGLEDPEENSNGTLVGDGATNVAILGNVYAKNNDRNPRLKEGTETVVANNLNFYNDKAIWIDGGASAAVLGNAYVRRFSFRDPVVFGDGSVYFDDNYVADPPLDGRPFQDVGTELSEPPLWPDGLEVMPAGDVEGHNRTYAGARPADRIYQEEKVVQQIAERWGSLDVDPNQDNACCSDIPDSTAEAGGYPDHGGTTHELDVPEFGLREWLRDYARAVETGEGVPGDYEDDAPPSAPENVQAEAESWSAISVEWDEATDEGEAGVGGYVVAVDGEDEVTVSSAETEATVTGLEPDTTYEVGVRAVDRADNEGPAAIAEATTDERGDFEGGSQFDYTDGFSEPAPWLETEDVQVITITEPDYQQVKDAFQTEGPRVVVFECSGTIEIEDETLAITEDACWVAGQTAPSPGITFVKGQFQVDADDCVVQHVRSRHGPGSEAGDVQSNDAVNSQDETANVVFDHVTASWGTDECMSIGYTTRRTSMLNCLAYEGLWDPYGESTDHNYATLIGDDASEVLVAGTVWAKTRGRIPRLKGGTETTVVNNLAYFFDESANADGSAVTSFVGNRYLGATDTGDAVLEGDPTAYYRDNVVTDPPLSGDFAGTDSEDSPPLWPDDLVELPVEDVEAHNLRYAGARPADRTEHDERIVQEIRERAGNDRLDSPYDYWVGHQDDVGGFPDLAVNYHDLEVPDAGLRQWLEQWALAVEEPGVEPPNRETDPECGQNADAEAMEVDGRTVCNVNGDQYYRDVNADGTVGNRDVGAFFQRFHLDAWDREEFDYSGNGRVSHGDVVALFDSVL